MLIQFDATRDSFGLGELRTKLGGTALHFVERRPSPEWKEGACYWNVRDQVETHGGKIVFGWMLYQIPALALSAWHHAVWRQPSGELLDISAHPLTKMAVGTTAFIEDQKQSYNLLWPPAMKQVFHLTEIEPRLEEFIAAYEDMFEIQKEYLHGQQRIPGTSYDYKSGMINVTGPDVQAQLDELSRLYIPVKTAAESRCAHLFGGLIEMQTERLSTK